jgi:pyruvate dehydrogenase E2 component (dihydrolipoamide acetyltransferase)
MIEFRLPSLGSDMDDGTLLAWRVAPGSVVHRGDVIAVVDTSKAAIDVESWVEGTVHRLVTTVGETIPVGTVMAELLAPGETAPTTPAQPGPPLPRRPISPVARRRAEALGLAVDTVPGSGPDGAVTLADVERAARTGTAPEPEPAPSTEPSTEPSTAAAAAPARLAAMRQAIAAAMSRSKREIPHYYLAETLRLDQAMAWLSRRNAERPPADRLLPAVLLIKAVALALEDAPELNGHVVDGMFRPATAVHVGMAIALRQGGLMAPALHDVPHKDLDRLMRELADLVARCRAGSLRSGELADPTITVTNLGDQGAEAVFGVIHPPQVALVGFGRIVQQPALDGGTWTAVPVVRATLAGDHRVSDGHRGSRFLAALGERLQAPESL